VLLPFAAAAAAMATKIATMRTLQGHPNMLTLHEVFEDAEGFHVVVEFCKGKAMLEAIHDRVRMQHCFCKLLLQAVPANSSCKLFLQAVNHTASRKTPLCTDRTKDARRSCSAYQLRPACACFFPAGPLE
jgi:hypothetical protein